MLMQPLQTSYPQFVLLGDSLFNNCIEIQDGFSLQAELQQRTSKPLASTTYEHMKD